MLSPNEVKAELQGNNIYFLFSCLLLIKKKTKNRFIDVSLIYRVLLLNVKPTTEAGDRKTET